MLNRFTHSLGCLIALSIVFATPCTAEEHPFKSETLKVHKKHPLIRKEEAVTSNVEVANLEELWERYQAKRKDVNPSASHVSNRRVSKTATGVLVSE